MTWQEFEQQFSIQLNEQQKSAVQSVDGPVLLLAAFYLTFSLILIIQPHSLRSIVSFSGFAVAAQISRFLPSVRLGSLLISLVVCFRHLFSLREHETENAAFTIQSLSAKIRKKQKKE